MFRYNDLPPSSRSKFNLSDDQLTVNEQQDRCILYNPLRLSRQIRTVFPTVSFKCNLDLEIIYIYRNLREYSSSKTFYKTNLSHD